MREFRTENIIATKGTISAVIRRAIPQAVLLSRFIASPNQGLNIRETCEAQKAWLSYIMFPPFYTRWIWSFIPLDCNKLAC